MLLSICIPNYKREECLNNCLNSIYIAKKNFNLDFEVCISDNNSGNRVNKIVNNYKNKFSINFKKNKKNFGVGYNILKSVSLAKGKYSWIIGNDDLLLPQAFKKLNKILNKKNIDFFYVNSFNLKSEFVFKFKKKFNTNLIPKNLKKISPQKKDRYLSFFELIHPDISFDYLMGSFLSIFRTTKWRENLNIIDKGLLIKKGVFSSFENTCPHVKIFAKSFSKSQAYFVANPLSVNLSGIREWGSLWDFIEIIRMPQILDEYRKNGLSFFRYYYCKNNSLRNFIPCLLKIVFFKDNKNYKYISFYNHIVKNFLFINVYLSFFNYLYRKFLIKKKIYEN
jgi:glycosyltransferase involved in cell wall biosynthesis